MGTLICLSHIAFFLYPVRQSLSTFWAIISVFAGIRGLNFFFNQAAEAARQCWLFVKLNHLKSQEYINLRANADEL
jgi:hypothetical protein